MKKLTTSVLTVVLASSFGIGSLSAQEQDSVQTTQIQEVVVTGALGIKRTPDAITSAQKVVTAEKLTEAANPDPVQALAAKVTGLQINLTNSSVNPSTSIQLRGIRTITGNNSALVVIDGAISNATVLSTLPADAIESINVIKGAQGAALYGSDGVNGVIIVTTKAGSKRGLKVSYQGSIDFESVAFLPERQTKYGQGWYGNHDQYENGAWGALLDGHLTAYGLPQYDYDGDGVIDLTNGLGWGGSDITSGDQPAAMIYPYEARPDEVENFFNTGTIINNNITINAGDQDKFAFLNIGNTLRRFVIEGDKSNKTSFMFKGGAKVGKLKFNAGINYIRRDTRQTPTLMPDESSQQESIYWNLLQSASDIPITAYKQYPDNAYGWNAYYINPYWRIKHVRQKIKRDYISVTAGATYEFNDHINLRYTGNIQKTVVDNQRHRDAWSPETLNYVGDYVPTAYSSAFYITKQDALSYYGDLLLNFDYDLTSDLNLKLNLGQNYQEHRSSLLFNGGSNLAIPGLYTMSNVTLPIPASDAVNEQYRSNSFAVFANLDLAYRDFLYLNVTGRNEWTSTLAKGNRSYFYPSVGLSIVPTNLGNFGGKILNYLKVSGNWTRVGNTSSVGTYAINKLAVLASGYPFNGISSFRNSRTPADPNIRPEFVTTKEVNLAVGLFKNRITLNGSLYEQDTKDLITRQSTSTASGINNQLINIGKMRSRGAEINLGITPIRTRDFKWDINVGYSYTENRVLKVTDDTDEVSLGGLSIAGIYAQKGALFPLIKVTKMKRDPLGRIIIDPTTGNPEVEATLSNAGVAAPKSIYQFSTSVSYKGFKLGATASLRLGHKFIAQMINGLAFNGTLWESGQVDRFNGGFIMPNSVIPDGNGGYIPNTTVKTGGNTYTTVNNYYSSLYGDIGENYLKDGKTFKIREIYLSYTLPKSLIKGAGLEEVTLGLHARNPWIKLADDNLGYADPENNYLGGTAMGFAGLSQYPTLKSYGFSLNVKF